MKSIYILFYIGITMIPFKGLSQNDFVTTFTPVWNRSTEYLTEVADAMPEEFYTYTPTPDVMSFKEHLLHVVDNIRSLHGRFVSPSKDLWEKPDPEHLTKEEVIEELTTAFKIVDESLASISPEELNQPAENFWSPDHTTRQGIFLLIRDHMTHHRGQLVIYLRMNQITPPRYRGW